MLSINGQETLSMQQHHKKNDLMDFNRDGSNMHQVMANANTETLCLSQLDIHENIPETINTSVNNTNL